MRIALMLTALMLGPVNIDLALAQERQNFSGSWVMDMTRSESAAQAADAIPNWLHNDDLVLLKGSRSMHLEYVDAAIKKSRNEIESPPTKAAS